MTKSSQNINIINGFSCEQQYPSPPALYDLDQLQYHISLQELGDLLQKAVNAAFPNDKRMRYCEVFVLLLSWEDEDPKLPISHEIEDLKTVMADVCNFNIQE
jgi:hypothetical protein